MGLIRDGMMTVCRASAAGAGASAGKAGHVTQGGGGTLNVLSVGWWLPAWLQVLGDKHGNIIYFPERECSIQRRNQKVHGLP